MAVGCVQWCSAKSCKGALFFVARERMVMFEKKRLMYPELRVRVQVDNIKLHLRSMSFDLREKTGDSFEFFKKCELLTTSCLSRTVTIEAKQVWSFKVSLMAEASVFLR